MFHYPYRNAFSTAAALPVFHNPHDGDKGAMVSGQRTIKETRAKARTKRKGGREGKIEFFRSKE